MKNRENHCDSLIAPCPETSHRANSATAVGTERVKETRLHGIDSSKASVAHRDIQNLRPAASQNFDTAI